MGRLVRIAELAGLSDFSVREYRTQLEARGVIKPVEKHIGKDGKERPSEQLRDSRTSESTEPEPEPPKPWDGKVLCPADAVGGKVSNLTKWVFIIGGIFALIQTADLITTYLCFQTGGAGELNPLARLFIHNLGFAVGFKYLITGIMITIGYYSTRYLKNKVPLYTLGLLCAGMLAVVVNNVAVFLAIR